MTPERGTAQSVLFTTSSVIGPGRSRTASIASDEEGVPSEDGTAACVLAAQPAVASASSGARETRRVRGDGFFEWSMADLSRGFAPGGRGRRVPLTAGTVGHSMEHGNWLKTDMVIRKWISPGTTFVCSSPWPRRGASARRRAGSGWASHAQPADGGAGSAAGRGPVHPRHRRGGADRGGGTAAPAGAAHGRVGQRGH